MKWKEALQSKEYSGLEEEQKRKKFFRANVANDPQYGGDVERLNEVWREFNEYADSVAPPTKEENSLAKMELLSDALAIGDLAKKISPFNKGIDTEPLALAAAKVFGINSESESDLNSQINEIRSALPDRALRRRESGILRAIREGARESTINKIRLSMDKRNIQEKDDMTLDLGGENAVDYSDKKKYEPQSFLEKLAYGVSSVAADMPIYAAGQRAGGSMGAFGVPSGIKEVYEKKLAGELPTYTIEDLFQDRKFTPEEWDDVYNTMKSVSKETGKGMLEGLAFGASTRLVKGLSAEVNMLQKFKKAGAAGALPEGMTFAEFRDAALTLAPGAKSAAPMIEYWFEKAHPRLGSFARSMSREMVEDVMPGALGKTVMKGTELLTEGTALAGASSLVRGEDFTLDKLLLSTATVGMLKLGSAFQGKAMTGDREAFRQAINKDTIDRVQKALPEITDKRAIIKLLGTEDGRAWLEEKIASRGNAEVAQKGIERIVKGDMFEASKQGFESKLEGAREAIPVLEKSVKDKIIKDEKAPSMGEYKSEVEKERAAKAEAVKGVRNIPEEAPNPADVRVPAQNAPAPKAEKVMKNQDSAERIDQAKRSIIDNMDDAVKRGVFEDRTMLYDHLDQESSGFAKLNKKEKASVERLVHEELDKQFNPERIEKEAERARMYEELNRPLENDIEDVGQKLQAFEENLAPEFGDLKSKIAEIKKKALPEDREAAAIKEAIAAEQTKEQFEKIKGVVENPDLPPEGKLRAIDVFDPDPAKTWANLAIETDGIVANHATGDMTAGEKIWRAKNYMIKSFGRALTEAKSDGKPLVNAIKLMDSVDRLRKLDDSLNGGWKEAALKSIRKIEKNMQSRPDKQFNVKFDEFKQDLWFTMMDDLPQELKASRYAKFVERFGPEEFQRVKQAAEESRAVFEKIAEASIDAELVIERPWVSRWNIERYKGTDKLFIEDHWYEPIMENGEIKLFDTFDQAKQYKADATYTPFERHEGEYISHYVDPRVKDNKPMDIMVDGKKVHFEKPYFALVEYLWDTGQLPREPKWKKTLDGKKAEKVKSIAEQYINSGNDLFTVRNGTLEMAREYKLPEWAYLRDYTVMERYIDGAAGRIAKAKEFGPRDEIVNQKIVDIAFESAQRGLPSSFSDLAKARKLVGVITGKAERDASLGYVTDNIMHFNVIRKMPLSALSQIPQWFMPIVRTGYVVPLAKAFRAMHGADRAESYDLTVKAGVALKSQYQTVLNEITDRQSMMARGSSWMLDHVGFTKRDTRNRVAAALSADFAVRDVLVPKLEKAFKKVEQAGIINPQEIVNKYFRIEEAKRLGEEFVDFSKAEKKAGKDVIAWARKIADYDINVQALISRAKTLGDFSLTESERLQAMRAGEVQTNFRAYVEDLPEFRTSLGGKIITQFKTFSFEQAKTMNRFVLGEARKGNFRPLLMVPLAMGIPGALVMELRSLLSNKPGQWTKFFNTGEGDEFLSALWETYSTGGALAGFDIVSGFAKYGDPGLGPSIGGLMKAAEMVSELYKTEDSLAGSSLEKRLKVAGVWALSELPFGGTLKRTFVGQNRADEEYLRAQKDPIYKMKLDIRKERAKDPDLREIYKTRKKISDDLKKLRMED